MGTGTGTAVDGRASPFLRGQCQEPCSSPRVEMTVTIQRSKQAEHACRLNHLVHESFYSTCLPMRGRQTGRFATAPPLVARSCVARFKSNGSSHGLNLPERVPVDSVKGR
ncbi:MAG: hypothetical protein JW395_2734 [Nitrospira sp.]|nr:hypothetical protein [Nitrospira sp.]